MRFAAVIRRPEVAPVIKPIHGWACNKGLSDAAIRLSSVPRCKLRNVVSVVRSLLDG
jgi:hypothetical protein